MDAFVAVKNIDPKSAAASIHLPRMLVVDDDAFSVVHSPILDNSNPEETSVIFPENDQIQLYTVREGDTIYDIARMFNVSINTVLWANDLSFKSTIKAGQVMVILPVNGVKYTVKSGDTVESIAKKLNANVEDINNFNALDGSALKLVVGDELIIPGGEISGKTVNVTASTKSSKNWIPPTQNGLISGYFIRPVPNGVKTQGLHTHNGIDIGAPIGSNILAAAEGTVIVSRSGGWGGGYGSYVIIQHPNGMQTLYAHMSKVLVNQGQSVKQGELIGKVGSTGRSTGPHLHLELHMKGGPNPQNKFY